MIMLILLVLAMRASASAPRRQGFESFHRRDPLTFKTLDPAADNFAGLVGSILYRHRSFLIQVLLKFRHLGLEAPVVHDITDFRQKPSNQGRIFF